MSILSKTASIAIASGAALSGAVCLGSNVLSAIQMPAAWTAADLTFQVSDDRGQTWVELLDTAGNPIKVATPAAGARVELDAADFKDALFLKVRSGTAAIPVNQAADRALTLISRKYYATE